MLRSAPWSRSIGGCRANATTGGANTTSATSSQKARRQAYEVIGRLVAVGGHQHITPRNPEPDKARFGSNIRADYADRDHFSRSVCTIIAGGAIIRALHACHWNPVRGLVRTKSALPSARAAWERSTRRATRGWNGR